MTTAVQFVLEMTARVWEFLKAYPSTDPGYVIVVNRLQETRARAVAMSARQHTGLTSARGAREKRNALKRSLQQELVRYLIGVGAVVAKDRTELAAKFKLPRLHASNQVFLVSVKALLAEAEGQRDLLVKEGMSANLLDDLRLTVAQLEAATEATRSSRRDHMGASADLELVSRDLMDLVKLVDGMNRWRFRKEPEVLAEWNAAKAMPVKGKVAGTPPSTGSVAPAA